MSTLSMLGRGRTRLVELTPGLILLAGIVAAAYAVHSALPYASPIAVAVLLGLVIANTLRWPVRASAGTAFAARRLLRAGVVLLGLQISLGAVREIGLPVWPSSSSSCSEPSRGCRSSVASSASPPR